MFKNVWTYNAFEFRKTCLSNKQMQWLPYGLDTYDSWKENKSKYPNIITYNPEDVSYSYNSFGFRMNEYQNEPIDILALGCSFTEGIGIKNEDIWINRLSKYLGFDRVANFGIGGCGVETLSRSAYYALNVVKIKPKIIIALFPNLYRTEGFINNLDFSEPIFDFLPQQPFFKDQPGYEKEWQNYVKTLNVKNRIHSLIKEILFLNTLSKSIGTKFIWHTWSPILDCSYLNEIDKDKILNLKNINILLSDNKSIDFLKLLKLIAPQEVLVTALSDECLWKHRYSENLPLVKNMPEQEIPKEMIARDFMHPGPLSHLVFAKSMYDIIIDKKLL